MRVLLVEDEEAIAQVVRKGLERAGYAVTVAADGDSGLERAIEGGWSLILLDLMLPGIDGLEICRRLRLRRDRTPLLMLTARDAVPDRVRGLETGADDYLPKPFAFEELLARVRALLRRDLEIDSLHRTATRAGAELPLTPREWSLLETLARHEGRPVTRETILAHVWADEGRTASNVVDVAINQLRRKIDADVPAPQRLIHTVHGVGYVLRRPTDDGGDAPA